ncbi:hypothetical protein NG796_11010 [Laspinema sp. A4]|nr:hypothetical protein [Laspinema sp. D2d]
MGSSSSLLSPGMERSSFLSDWKIIERHRLTLIDSNPDPHPQPGRFWPGSLAIGEQSRYPGKHILLFNRWR